MFVCIKQQFSDLTMTPLQGPDSIQTITLNTSQGSHLLFSINSHRLLFIFPEIKYSEEQT